MEGATCAECGCLFVGTNNEATDVPKDQQKMASVKHAVYCCIQRNQGCSHCICYACMSQKMAEVVGRATRRRR